MRIYINLKELLLSFILAFYIFLSQFKLVDSIEILTIGNIVITIFLILYFKKNIHVDKYFMLWLVSMVITQIIFHIKDTTVNLALMMLFYSMCVMFYSNNIVRSYFEKIYYLLGVFATIVVIIQFIQIFIFNTNPIFQFLMNIDLQANARPSGIFSEPQAYVSFIIFLVVLCLKNNKLIKAMFFSIGIICSTSSTGIFLLCFIWAVYYFFEKHFFQKMSISKILMFILIIAIIYMFFNISVFDFSLQKIRNINFSMDVRLTRGFYTYFHLPISTKIIGVGFYNIYNYLVINNLYFSWIFGSLIPEYITGLSGILVYFGIIPFIFFMLMIVKHYKENRKSKYKLMLIGIVVLLMSIQTTLFNAWFVFIFGTYLYYIKEDF